MKSKRYVCRECGEEFEHSVLGSLLGRLAKEIVLVDPAPTPSSMFALTKPRCPKCGSKNLKN